MNKNGPEVRLEAYVNDDGGVNSRVSKLFNNSWTVVQDSPVAASYEEFAKTYPDQPVRGVAQPLAEEDTEKLAMERKIAELEKQLRSRRAPKEQPLIVAPVLAPASVEPEPAPEPAPAEEASVVVGLPDGFPHADVLEQHGYDTIEKVAALSRDELISLPRIGKVAADNIAGALADALSEDPFGA